MTVHGVLFSAPMVRALIAGRKTETRRLASSRLANVRPGDILWVRETFRLEDVFEFYPPAALKATNYTRMCVWHEADRGAPGPHTLSQWGHPFGRKRPAIHMPKWASRLALTVADTWTERLGDIAAAAAIAEGLAAATIGSGTRWGIPNAFGAPADDDADPAADGWPLRFWDADPRLAYYRLWAAVRNCGRPPEIAAVNLDQRVVAIRFAVAERNILYPDDRAAA